MSPWHTIRILPNGAVLYCDATKEQDFVKDDDYLGWWQSGAKLASVRSCIQEGKPYAGCQRCYDGTKNSESTFRSKKNFQAGIHHGKFFKHSLVQSPAYKVMQKTDLRGHLPTHVSLSFSNECNANCIMCHSKFSNKVAQDHRDFGIGKDETIDLYWQNKEAKIDNVISMIRNNDRLLYLKINGGEPFLQKECLEFIKKIIEYNKTDFKLVINTNATVWNQKLIDLLMRFEYCAIDIGIETYHKDNGYIRDGCNNHDVRTNIKKFLGLRQANKFEVYIHPVPQFLSIINFDTLIDYCNENKAPMFAQTIFSPRYMQIDVLPKDLRMEILEKWRLKYDIVDRKISQIEDTNFTADENINTNNKKLNQNLHNILTYVAEFLKAPEPENVDELRKELFDHVEKFDRKHSTNFKKTFPDLAPLYDRYISR